MTGYACAEAVTSAGKVEVEVHSVNRKGLDVNVILPREWLHLDVEVRKAVGRRIKRGQVTVRFTVSEKGSLPSVETLRAVKEAWETMGREVGVEGKVTLDFLFAVLKEMPLTGKVPFQEVEGALNEALQGMMEMRRQEGKVLADVFVVGIREVEEAVKKMEGCAKDMLIRYRERLTKRIEELNGDETRIAMEVALFADRSDIAEEMTRLKSHCTQMKGYLEKEGGGKELGFLLQEMLREISTTLAKSQEGELTQIALRAKGTIETMREQVMNIE